MRADALAAGDSEVVGAMDKLIALIEADAKRRDMPTTHDTTKSLRDGLRNIALARFGIDEKVRTGEISESQAVFQRASLRSQARDLDAAKQQEIAELAADAEGAALAKRAEWFATSDPMTRYAADYPRLMASPEEGDNIAAQAEWMLDNGQPERASFLLQVARDKGARVSPTLHARVEDALDATQPLRKEARALEEDLASSLRAFNVARRACLADAGFGVRDDGSIGEGHPSEIATASASSKIAAYIDGQRGGFAVGDGTNPEAAS